MSAEARRASARHAFDELAAAHPDERLCAFVLDAMAKNEPALPYYRGPRWEKRLQVEMIDGNPVSSGFSVKWRGLSYCCGLACVSERHGRGGFAYECSEQTPIWRLPSL